VPPLRNPFDDSGLWLRCALHTHTTNSDGELSPELLAEHYARAGYDVLAITDHWRRTETTSSEQLLVIPSAELNCLLPGERDGHVLAFGIDEEPMELARTRPDLAAAAGWIGEHGGVAYLAHPYWTGALASELDLPDAVAGLEVYNAGCELETARGLSSVHWDEVLEAGRLCFGIAADDSHHPGFDSDLAWVWVRVSERSQRAALEALAAGCFYSSTGPVIHGARIEDGAVEVGCSPCRSVTLCTGRERGSAVNGGRLGFRYGAEVVSAAGDGAITGARLERPRGGRYGRVEVVDLQGRKAWTNPLWI
jgi:predicted metal-dependent phosphoesterase TrpH